MKKRDKKIIELQKQNQNFFNENVDLRQKCDSVLKKYQNFKMKMETKL